MSCGGGCDVEVGLSGREGGVIDTTSMVWKVVVCDDVYVVGAVVGVGGGMILMVDVSSVV